MTSIRYSILGIAFEKQQKLARHLSFFRKCLFYSNYGSVQKTLTKFLV